MSATANTKQTIYLKDYTVPEYLISHIDLDIDLHLTVTIVKSQLRLSRNPASTSKNNSLVLVGEHMQLKSIMLNANPLTSDQYSCDAKTLTINNVPSDFVLDLTTEIKPQDNTSLSGLYKSSSMYCTQCEAEGFRRITYYLDRPDVMAQFCVTIHADKKAYPVLLSNGNLIDHGEDDADRHYVTWEDPYSKPCYLFAMVAGDLIAVEDNFVTMSGRLVKLKLYIERENLEQSAHAMLALKKSMAWDELAYGREYDLDIYMIVAVNDFNMGAMENKGLNIFNTACVLASPSTATDLDFQTIDAVVGHEYFHNWSGNRVTCRDWFQLSIKEGFTVFREQQFSEYISKSPVSRIEDVKVLMVRQFSEDSGPLAHSVRPESYMEINNFYTMTIYEKGAEVIRMLHTILGAEKFRAGTDLYFSRHDGHAVTAEDFVAAMQEASGIDLQQFKLWYVQAGTPEVTVTESYDAQSKSYKLKLAQHTPDTPGQTNKAPVHIPVVIGLLDQDGKDIPLENTVLSLKQSEQVFEFKNISVQPKLSILRNFSAPVKIKHEVSAEHLAFMLAHDSDDFNRWYAGQQLYLQTILLLIQDLEHGKTLHLPETMLSSFKAVLLDNNLNLALKAELLSMPSNQQIIDNLKQANPELVYAVKKFVVTTLEHKLHNELLEKYYEYKLSGPYQYKAEHVAARTCKNTILAYLLLNKSKEAISLGLEQYQHANNMTDAAAALGCLANIDCKEREEALADFYAKWESNALVVNKWLRIQAMSDIDDVLEQIKALRKHPAFDLKNPNNVQALIGAYCIGNLIRFHSADGEGYKFLADIVLELNAINPQVAARTLRPLTQWHKFVPELQTLMCAQLSRIKQSPNLSSDVLELVTKTLNNHDSK
jgi:aminopeptidase N